MLDSVLCWVALVVQSQRSQNKWTAPPQLLLFFLLLLLCPAFCSSCPPTPTIESNCYLRFNQKPVNFTRKFCQGQNSWCLMVLEGCIICYILSTTSLVGPSVSSGRMGGGERTQSWKQWLFQTVSASQNMWLTILATKKCTRQLSINCLLNRFVFYSCLLAEMALWGQQVNK